MHSGSKYRWGAHLLRPPLDPPLPVWKRPTVFLCEFMFHSVSSLQVEHPQLGPSTADHAPHGAGHHQLLPHAHLHDLQRLALHRRRPRRRHGLLRLWLEEGHRRRHQRTLPLIENSRPTPKASSGSLLDRFLSRACLLTSGVAWEQTIQSSVKFSFHKCLDIRLTLRHPSKFRSFSQTE